MKIENEIVDKQKELAGRLKRLNEPTVEKGKFENYFTEYQNAKLDLEKLQNKVAVLRGNAGSGLASFCRANDGLARIISIMQDKIESKFAAEGANNAVEICKALIASSTAPLNEKMSQSCLRAASVRIQRMEEAGQ